MLSSIFKTDSSSSSIDPAYGTNNWFQEENWDFTKAESIPNSAIVEAVGIHWNFPQNNRLDFSNIYATLFNRNGNGEWLDSGILNYSFRGEPIKQLWTTSFLVTQPLQALSYIQPTLTMTWFDPESLQSGTIEVASNKKQHYSEGKGLNNKKLKERREHPLKIDSKHPIQNVGPNYYNPLATKWCEENSNPTLLEHIDEFVKSDSSIILDAKPIELVNINENSITILKGISYALGNINGKPLQALLMEGGGIESNFRPKIFKGPNFGEQVTPEQINSLKIKLSYSKEEHNEAQRRTSVFSVLYDLANGKVTTDYFNQSQYSQHFEEFAVNIGLDLSIPFLLNGKQFEFNNGAFYPKPK
ncbi:hypothetical protein [Schinkia azotoformans]|uniref:hypothetical protein n=1 Tax=Schinkia azotoformans TaxID=1454 RepID=UPI002DBF7CF5|nr:hypothetical protein [Schinkia azotoformans]MEC1716237.1 hypothetical protein [Schinkia azotoformans]MEC1739869.1 hypothetical protein [Schinkia azotoformans]MEC1744281.1 hypothetical protein [Schinkia azotoformans]MEC1767603.1 hypothetical protein [Schinkia azotoformans]MEC1787769.1 hypothetical protein [Schinkia azotoformans]